MALFPTIAPVSVNKLAAVVICPHCGDEEHQRMQAPGKDPIKPGDKVLFRSTCTKAATGGPTAWGSPGQTAYYIQFPNRRTI